MERENIAGATAITAGICTLGCKVNQYESEAIAEAFAERNVAPRSFEESCDIYVVNTCTVTGESDRKAGQMIRRAVRRNPSALVIVTGCYAQAFPDKVAAIEGVDIVCGNRRKLAAVELAADYIVAGRRPAAPVVMCDGLEDAGFEDMRIRKSERTRAYIKIEDGCDGKCAYCIIPSVRGPVRSKRPDAVVEEARGLVASGYSELVLTGIETSAYGYGLTSLLRSLGAVKGLERIRIGSLDPASMGRDFADTAASLGYVMPHFHVSLQSGCDETLHRMRRKYNISQVRENLAYIRSVIPNAAFSADVICGFPGETEEEFESSLRFIEEISFLHLHVFTYSKRPGTEAASMPEQIPETVKNQRAARMTALSEHMERGLREKRARSGATVPVLVEGWDGKSGFAWGHAPDFHCVFFRCPRDRRGEIANIKLTETDEDKLYGVCL